MKYTACYFIPSLNKRAEDAVISIEKEGLVLGKTMVDFADVDHIRPINHRVFVDLKSGDCIEISMLGFSYDGFFEELMECFGNRSLEALFVDEAQLMACEGEYELPAKPGCEAEKGRGRIMLYPDSVCILPQTSHAVRIPLSFTTEIRLEGYYLSIAIRSGETFIVGKMGYDTMPFAERCMKCADHTKKERSRLIRSLKTEAPFLHAGLFRTRQAEEFWAAAVGEHRCAVELYTGDNAATYLYSFSDQEQFLIRLDEAMEAVGSHRELIFLSEGQLQEKPLYRMAVERSRAVCFLRGCSQGRLIHNNSHAEKLKEFLAE